MSEVLHNQKYNLEKGFLSSSLYLFRVKGTELPGRAWTIWSCLDTEEYSPDVDQTFCSALNVYLELPSGVLLRRIFDSTVKKELTKTQLPPLTHLPTS